MLICLFSVLFTLDVLTAHCNRFADCLHRLASGGSVDFQECPTAQRSIVVDGGNPEVAGGVHLCLFVFLFLAGDLNNEVQEVVDAVAIVDLEDVIGIIVSRSPLVRVGYAEVEILILDVGQHFVHAFDSLNELRLPAAVLGNEVEMAFRRFGLPDGTVGAKFERFSLDNTTR